MSEEAPPASRIESGTAPLTEQFQAGAKKRKSPAWVPHFVRGAGAQQQVTLRLPRDVIGHFKAGGPGWQTRIGEVLQRHAKKGRRKSA